MDLSAPSRGDVSAGEPAMATVRGVGVVAARPDGVRVTFTVQHRAGTADEALAETAHKAEALEGLFGDAGIDPEHWVTTRLSLDEWTEWEESSRRDAHRGYVASNRVDVTVRDLGSLGRLLAEAVGRTEAGVRGPWWHVASDNPAHQASRRMAMTDARRRAEDYMGAAGLVLGDLIEVVEVGAEHARHMTRPARSGGYVLSGGGGEMPVHGEGLEVVAAVDATYRVSTA